MLSSTRFLLLATLSMTLAASARGQSCCQSTPAPVAVTVARPAYRVVYQTVNEYQPVTTYRLEYETVFEEKQITVQKPIWTTEYQERRYRVAKPVVETSEREESYTVLRPVWEESYRECSYDQVKYVTETEVREQRYTVQRPVWQETFREQQRVVRRPVTETVMQDHSYTTYDPVCTMRTEYVDQGGYVDQTVFRPGPVRNCLQRVPANYTVDPTTQTSFYRPGGLYWVPNASQGTYTTQRVYVPNVVAVQRPQTQYVARVVTEQRPVQVMKYVDEVIVEKIPVKVCQMQQTEEVQQIPVTVQKPIVERVNYKVPVKTCRYERQEMVRKIPVSVQKMVYEDRVEQIPVRVCKYVTETQVVQQPRTVATWKAYQTTQCVPRTVAMRVPIDPCGGCSVPTETFYAAPANGSTVVVPETTTQRVPTPADEPVTEDQAEGESVLKSGEAGAAEDRESTGQPKLEADVPPAVETPPTVPPAAPAPADEKPPMEKLEPTPAAGNVT